MIPPKIDFTNFKTVLPTYSWDQGTPGVDYNSYLYLTTLSECKATSTLNDEKVEYVGYAPFAFVGLSSDPGEINATCLAIEQTVDFGDYYNSETNVVKNVGLSSAEFCHIYIMPGLYDIKYTKTEYLHYEYLPLDGEGKCLQKYCVDWSYGSLKQDIPRQTQFTWENAKSEGVYSKLWSFERCDANDLSMAGLYIQPSDISVKHPLSWQWYHFLKNPIDLRNDPITWLSAGFQQPKQITWNDSGAPCVSLPVEGITWRWDNLKPVSPNATTGERLLTKPLSWDQVASFSPLNTTWDFAQDHCSMVGTIVLSAVARTVTKTASVRIKEVPPIAYITADYSADRYSPLKVRLSPKNIITGSFPIEKIVWDLGDGSPLLEQRRWSNTLQSPFVYSNAASEDYEDPRNYDIVHTYTRTLSSPITFYASLTAYAANTNTSDSASVMIGPLKYKPTDGSNFRLLQSEITDQGKVLMGQLDNTNIGLWKIDKAPKEVITIQQTYYYFGYYSADRPLINGVSVLYTGIYSNSPKAASLSGYRVFDETTANDGGSSPDLSLWKTDEMGVISWSKYEKHPIPLDIFVDLDANPLLATKKYNFSDTYFVDTSAIISGESILWKDNGSTAGVAANQFFNNLDIDDNGKLDTFSTDTAGVITWATLSAYSYNEALGGYTLNFKLTSGVSKLYDSPFSDAGVVRLAEGEGYLNGEIDISTWTTDGYGVINFTTKLLHPHAIGTPLIGYVDDVNFESGAQVLWSDVGSSGGMVADVNSSLAEILTSYIPNSSVNPDISIWGTDSAGVLSWQMYPAHPYFFTEGGSNGYWFDTEHVTKDQSIVWTGKGTSAVVAAFLSGQSYINGYKSNWQTNSNGIISFSELSAHIYGFPLVSAEDTFGVYYADSSLLVSKDEDLNVPGSLIYSDYSPEADLIKNSVGVGRLNGDMNLYNWSTDEFGQITFSLLSAHPFKQTAGAMTIGYSDTEILTKAVSKIWNGPGTAASLVTRMFGRAKYDPQTGKIS